MLLFSVFQRVASRACVWLPPRWAPPLGSVPCASVLVIYKPSVVSFFLEGGSKGVCLVTPAVGTSRAELLHGCVKATVDGLLDLLNPTSLVLLGENASNPPDREQVPFSFLFSFFISYNSHHTSGAQRPSQPDLAGAVGRKRSTPARQGAGAFWGG